MVFPPEGGVSWTGNDKTRASSSFPCGVRWLRNTAPLATETEQSANVIAQGLRLARPTPIIAHSEVGTVVLSHIHTYNLIGPTPESLVGDDDSLLLGGFVES